MVHTIKNMYYIKCQIIFIDCVVRYNKTPVSISCQQTTKLACEETGFFPLAFEYATIFFTIKDYFLSSRALKILCEHPGLHKYGIYILYTIMYIIIHHIWACMATQSFPFKFLVWLTLFTINFKVPYTFNLVHHY